MGAALEYEAPVQVQPRGQPRRIRDVNGCGGVGMCVYAAAYGCVRCDRCGRGV